MRSVATCYLPATDCQSVFLRNWPLARYFTFSHTRVTTLIFPSPENGAAALYAAYGWGMPG